MGTIQPVVQSWQLHHPWLKTRLEREARLQLDTIDLCSAQETRWKGESVRMLGAIGRRYKFFLQCCNNGTACVSAFIVERWIDSVVDVVIVNERTMYVKLVIGKQIVNIVSTYAPQVG